jgi:putative flippase GtrA
MQRILKTRDHVLSQSIRYLFAGGLVFLIDLLVFVAISHSLPDMVVEANLASKVAGGFFGFFIHNYWTFSWTKTRPSSFQYFSYAGLLIFNMILSSILVYLLVIMSGIPAIVGKLISDVAVIITAFLLSRAFVFKGKTDGGHGDAQLSRGHIAALPALVLHRQNFRHIGREPLAPAGGNHAIAGHSGDDRQCRYRRGIIPVFFLLHVLEICRGRPEKPAPDCCGRPCGACISYKRDGGFCRDILRHIILARI